LLYCTASAQAQKVVKGPDTKVFNGTGNTYFTLLDAARDLGASRARALRQVFLPGIRRGISTAAIVVFIPMLGSYIIPELVGGKENEMIGNKIAQRNFNDRNLPQAAAISAALTLAVLLPFAIRRRPRSD
jgi:spermidine/putrescine transport system permease protein